MGCVSSSPVASTGAPSPLRVPRCGIHGHKIVTLTLSDADAASASCTAVTLLLPMPCPCVGDQVWMQPSCAPRPPGAAYPVNASPPAVIDLSVAPLPSPTQLSQRILLALGLGSGAHPIALQPNDGAGCAVPFMRLPYAPCTARLRLVLGTAPWVDLTAAPVMRGLTDYTPPPRIHASIVMAARTHLHDAAVGAAADACAAHTLLNRAGVCACWFIELTPDMQSLMRRAREAAHDAFNTIPQQLLQACMLRYSGEHARGRFAGYAQAGRRQWLQLRASCAPALIAAARACPLPAGVTEDARAAHVNTLQGALQVFMDAFTLQQQLAHGMMLLLLLAALRHRGDAGVDAATVANDVCNALLDPQAGSDGVAPSDVMRVYEYATPRSGAPTIADTAATSLHADLGLITVAPLSSHPSLMALDGNAGEWIPIERLQPADCAVAFMGETLGYILQGACSMRPLLHYVTEDYADSTRWSMPLFMRARADARLKTLEQHVRTARSAVSVSDVQLGGHDADISVADFIERGVMQTQQPFISARTTPTHIPTADY